MVLPNEYAGVAFASRVAARWATFFDELSWRWRYREKRFGRWIPDFELTVADREAVWVRLCSAKSFTDLISRGAPDVSLRDFSGRVLIVGAGPLDRRVLGAFGVLPSPDWKPLSSRALGCPDVDLRATWNAAVPQHVPPPLGDVCPETYGGKTLHTWQETGEAFAQRWGSPADIRDWGLTIARLSETDPVVAGTLAGVERARIDDESLHVWLPRYSIRGGLLVSMGFRAHEVVRDALELGLEIYYTDRKAEATP